MNVAINVVRWPVLRDARLFQIAFLACLLSIGVVVRDFSLLPAQMALAFAAGITTQKLWIHALGIQHRGVLSAVITCFGLSILLRADSLWVHPLAAALAISAKFVIRYHGKHLYNPANLGVILAITMFPGEVRMATAAAGSRTRAQLNEPRSGCDRRAYRSYRAESEGPLPSFPR